MESLKKGEITYQHLGLRPYKEVWQLQTEIFQSLLKSKLSGNNHVTNYIITCQHNHVITLGKSGNESNIQVPEFPGVEYVRIDRGGDITYHGPGQLVVYPILDLEQFGLSLKQYIYKLEQAVIDTLNAYNISSGRIKEYTGVWVNHNSDHPSKIAAIGVKSSRHITMHGLAFNIHPDLNYFDLIIPCGIVGKSVTSMEKESGNSLDFEEVSSVYLSNLSNLLIQK
jgi:lipoyl(octanoyl) transferase